MVKYTYDAWGNCIERDSAGAEITDTDHIANLNPFRYRGYYYDTETELYYTSSRYYDSEIGRFINPDKIEIINATPFALTDKNLYAYCDNNPVIRVDQNGEFWYVFAGIVGAVKGFASSLFSELADNKEGIDWGNVGISTAIGGVEGALVALFPTATVAISSGASFLETAIIGIKDRKENRDSFGQIFVESLISGFFGAASAGMSGHTSAKGIELNNVKATIGNAFKKGVHPKVKKIARTQIKAWMKRIISSKFKEHVEEIACTGMENFFNWYVDQMFKRYNGR